MSNGKIFTGKCVGGPYDGRVQTAPYLALHVALKSEDIGFMDVGKEACEPLATEVRTYLFDKNKGVWEWQT